MPPDMPAAKLRPVWPMHHDDAAGHVLAAMVAGALDDRDRAGVAHREALAGDAAEIALAGDRAVEHGVADDDRALRHGAARSPDGRMIELAARQALADIVVGLAHRGSSVTPAARKAPKLWPAVPRQLHGDGVVRQARHGRSAWRPRPTAWRRPCGRRCGSRASIATARRRLERRRAPRAISLRSSTSSIGWSWRSRVAHRDAGPARRACRRCARSRGPCAFQWSIAASLVEQVGAGRSSRRSVRKPIAAISSRTSSATKKK